MAELSNHSYHYDRNLLTSIYASELLPQIPKVEEEEDEEMAEEIPEKKSDKKSKSSQKKKTRRKKRMLTGVSKQRRAANERERKRLQIINMAFKDLKGALPLFPTESNISKIEIVRLACRTIKYLSEMVDNEDVNSINDSRSPGGSVTSDNSESGSITTDSSYSDEQDTKNFDISNLLFHPDDLTAFGNDVPLPENIELNFNFKNENSNSCCSSSTSSSVSSALSDQSNHGHHGNHSVSQSTSSSSYSTSVLDGFSGFDISLFLEDDTDDIKDDDVFPSMLSLW